VGPGADLGSQHDGQPAAAVRAGGAALNRPVAIRRLREPPHPVTLAKGKQTRYELTLSAVPSAAWRAAFLRPPARLVTATASPELARLGLDRDRVFFRSPPSRLHYWLRWIDRWIAYANSVVAE
jgi:hypothetical protein